MENEIRQTWFFRHPPQEVWDFLTKSELIEQWLGKTDFQPVVGEKFRFISPYGNHSYCEVLEVKPYTNLSYTWRKSSSKDNKPFNSKVAWTLVPKDGGTELQLVHNGFTTFEDVDAHEKGWNICQKQLKELINSDKR